MNLTRYFTNFLKSSQAGGILLMICVAVSMLIANSQFAEPFQNLIDREIGSEALHLRYPLSVWINDGLMAIFFLLVGLEIKREFLEGELSSFKSASLPVFAAVGGIIVPALIYFALNHGTEYASGWAIPMATDIAFSLAVISMLGSRVPPAVKIFLAALAIVDDLGAILVIALFYSDSLEWTYLLIAFGIVLLLAVLNYFKVKNLALYLIPGAFLWYFMHHSGIHATIAGVLLAFTIPTNESDTVTSPLEKLEHALGKPVNFFIMPVFALANTNITLQPEMVEALFTRFGLGILLGLCVGKVLGINLFSWLAIKLKISDMPADSSWKDMIGAGMLAGIGFTMSIFIALLSFSEPLYREEAKFTVLLASILSGIIGFLILRSGTRARARE